MSSEATRPSREELDRYKVIVRNLPFTAQYSDIKQLFSKFGTIQDIILPINQEKQQNRGFAFIRFTNDDEVNKVISKNTVVKIGERRLFPDRVQASTKSTQPQSDSMKEEEKPEFHKNIQTVVEERKKKLSDAEQKPKEKKQKKEKPSEAEPKPKEKKSKKEKPSETEPKPKEKTQKKEKQKKTKVAKETEVKEEDDEIPRKMKRIESSKDEDPKKDKRKKNSERKEKKTLDKTERGEDAEDGKTVFIRNVPWDATQEQLQEKFSEFGKMEYALLCVAKDTQRPTGSAFVRYISPMSASAAIEYKSSTGLGISINGRELDVTPAVKREKAQTLKQERKKIGFGGEGKREDKRNLYLAMEGTIEQGSAAAEGMTELDWKKRNKIIEDKRKRLQSNPDTFISTTRLCFHNLPYFLTDKALKALACNACIYARKMNPRKPTETKRPSIKIVQAIVVREASLTGRRGDGKSKGFGFVEFSEHEDALMCLRILNNNPTALNQFLGKKWARELLRKQEKEEERKTNEAKRREMMKRDDSEEDSSDASNADDELGDSDELDDLDFEDKSEDESEPEPVPGDDGEEEEEEDEQMLKDDEGSSAYFEDKDEINDWNDKFLDSSEGELDPDQMKQYLSLTSQLDRLFEIEERKKAKEAQTTKGKKGQRKESGKILVKEPVLHTSVPAEPEKEFDQRRLIVEFAVENAQKLRKHTKIKEFGTKQKEQHERKQEFARKRKEVRKEQKKAARKWKRHHKDDKET
ncbi:putative RNA-binding protein [Blattamonas nauphoetae]|uniref:RNA-binding protein n=1 Tax=Blattamonas nauphoetae TaxID=2049346 RepID=A0ABQ9XXN4_9EUKA|nr:putative RNA-binding protein [Blattamonas nauphoetae]